MKYILVFVLLLFSKSLLAQYPGPIMDSLTKYQKLIDDAKSPEEKIRLALKIQKIISGKTAIDTAALSHLPTSKKEALLQRNKQVAEIKKLKQNIDTSHSRQDKYAFIQKLQAKNDSIKLANKDATKHAVLQEGLITLPNADQFLIDPLAPVDTSTAIIHCTYTQTAQSGKQSVSVTSAKATMYRQNGIIKIIGLNGDLPEFVKEKNGHLVKLVTHQDIAGSASRSPFNGTECHTHFEQTNQFAFAFYYNPYSNQIAASVGGGLKMIKLCLYKQYGDTSNAGVGFSCTNNSKTWVIAGKEGHLTEDGTFGNFSKSDSQFDFSYKDNKDGVSRQMSGYVVYAPPRYEAIVEATDTAIYRKWLPQGPDLNVYPVLNHEGRGNEINVKVTLWDNIKHAPAADPYTAIIKLNNVSKLPGYCMNFPEKDAKADDDPDMRFDNADSAIYKSWSKDRIETRNSSEPQYVNIVSYDYGAYAGITADVTLADGNTIRAHVRNSVSDTFTLPKRSDNSLIADYWKQLENASDKKDMDDDEQIMDHDKYKGDGLTLFEEYRGFLEDRKHFRGSAEKKDVMVCNKIATQRSQDGIDMCEATLNQYGNKVYIHSKFKDDEFGKKHDPDAEEQLKMDSNGVKTPMNYDRCINYNYVKDLHLVDQHGITMMQGDTALGYALAVLKNYKDIGPPKNYYFLVITTDFNPADSAWAEIRGTLDATGHLTVSTTGKAKILTDEYGVTVAHEMLHCFHVTHHGTRNSYDQCAFQYDAAAHQWYLTGIGGKPLRDANKNIIPQYPVHLYWEESPEFEILGSDIKIAEAKRWRIGGDNSTYSGVDDCIMRYDDARGYMHDSWAKVYLLHSAVWQQELTGITICNSTKGTGENDKKHPPVSRYGDAEAGHGNCIHQFCVSDKYD